MKKYIFILMLIFIFPLNIHAVSEVDYYIDEYKIEADIKQNGDMNVCEYIKQTGSFNGYIRDIFYKDGDSKYAPKNLSNLVVYDLNVATMSKGELFLYDDYAKVGDVLKYKVENSYEPTVTMYNALEDGTKGYVLCYTLEDSILIHNDVAELYYNFIPSGFEDGLNNVSVKVNLPSIDDTLRVWAHGALYGTVSKEDNDTNSYLYANINYVTPGEVVNVRMTFDKNQVSDSTRFTYSDELDNIIEEETKLANKANRERQREKNIFIFGILEFFIFLIFIIYAIIRSYIKYDKEHKINFNMEYYRDFPNNYGPDVLEFLIKRKNTTNSYSASILNMIYKKNVIVKEIENKKDYILTKAETFIEPLTKTEADILDFLINNIGNGKSVTLKEIKKYGKKESTANDFLDHFQNWKHEVEKDSSQYNFFEEKKSGSFSAIVILFTLVTFVVGIATQVFVTSFLGMWIGVGAAFYIMNISKRTKNGMLEYKKWMAFKKFLTDFGRFDEKELPEIVLWEKYLVYATVLGVADKLEKTMKIKIASYNQSDLTAGDVIMMNHMLRYNFVSSMNSSISNVYTASRSTIAASQASSASGGGGGFSGGGSFSGGGGGGGGRGF